MLETKKRQVTLGVLERLKSKGMPVGGIMGAWSNESEKEQPGPMEPTEEDALPEAGDLQDTPPPMETRKGNLIVRKKKPAALA